MFFSNRLNKYVFICKQPQKQEEGKKADSGKEAIGEEATGDEVAGVSAWAQYYWGTHLISLRQRYHRRLVNRYGQPTANNSWMVIDSSESSSSSSSDDSEEGEDA